MRRRPSPDRSLDSWLYPKPASKIQEDDLKGFNGSLRSAFRDRAFTEVKVGARVLQTGFERVFVDVVVAQTGPESCGQVVNAIRYCRDSSSMRSKYDVRHGFIFNMVRRECLIFNDGRGMENQSINQSISRRRCIDRVTGRLGDRLDKVVMRKNGGLKTEVSLAGVV